MPVRSAETALRYFLSFVLEGSARVVGRCEREPQVPLRTVSIVSKRYLFEAKSTTHFEATDGLETVQMLDEWEGGGTFFGQQAIEKITQAAVQTISAEVSNPSERIRHPFGPVE
jgi:hypothetical protein